MTKTNSQFKIPKLRFRGFEGEWKENDLRDIFREVSENVEERNIETYSITAGRGFVSQKEKFGKNISGKQNSKYTVLKPNQFTYNKGNSKTYKYGCIYLNKEGKEIAVPNVFISFEQKDSKMKEDFFAKLFESHYLDKSLRRIISSSARMDGLLNVSKKNFFKLKIKHPVSVEQQKISDFLGSVDSWIENQKQQKQKLEAYKKGMMQKIFSQEIRFKDENGKDFPEWEEKRLGEIVKFSKGKGISKADIVQGGENKCIRYGELYTTYSEVISDIASSTNTSLEKSFLSEDNDILMPTSDVTPNGLATASALSENGIILGGDILVIRSKKLFNKFFVYYVSVHKTSIMRLVSGVTVYHIYGSDMGTLMIKLPCIEEQQKISNFLISLDKKIEAKKSEIEKIENWKKGLMQGLFV